MAVLIETYLLTNMTVFHCEFFFSSLGIVLPPSASYLRVASLQGIRKYA